MVRHLDQLRSRAALETDMVPSDVRDEPIVDDESDESRDLPQEPETAVGNGERELPSIPPLAVLTKDTLSGSVSRATGDSTRRGFK